MMSRKSLTSSAIRAIPAVLLVAVALLGAAGVAQPAPIAPEKKARLEAAIARFMAANSTPGVSVAVVENGAAEWSAGFGTADIELSVPATSNTLYRLNR